MRQTVRSSIQLSLWAKQAQGFHHTNRACLSSSSPTASVTNQAGAKQVSTSSQQPKQDESKTVDKTTEKSTPVRKKTMAELDEELRLKLEGMSGDGGSAGVEYEGGKAEGLKRGVKSNMFRVI